MTADERAPLDVAALRAGVLGTSPVFKRIDVVDETGSTNADLIARAARGVDIDGAVLIAEHQTAGRGRQGRSWLGAPGAQIIMSVGVDAGRGGGRWGWLPLATGVAIVDAVATRTGSRSGSSGPTTCAGGRKLAGVLSEVAAPQRSIVVGIGLNVTLRGDEVAAPDATSLAELGVENPDRNRIVVDLLGHSGIGSRCGTATAGQASTWLPTTAHAASHSAPACARFSRTLRDRRRGRRRRCEGRLCIDRDGETIVVSAGT
jgi:BirA family biotin operon repressor/biotin-[acetyl-CoA-carboxylase] ligase